MRPWIWGTLFALIHRVCASLFRRILCESIGQVKLKPFFFSSVAERRSTSSNSIPLVLMRRIGSGLRFSNSPRAWPVKPKLLLHVMCSKGFIGIISQFNAFDAVRISLILVSSGDFVKTNICLSKASSSTIWRI